LQNIGELYRTNIDSKKAILIIYFSNQRLRQQVNGAAT